MRPRRATNRRPIVLDGQSLSLELVEAVANGRACALAPASRRRVRAAREAVLRELRSGKPVYGVNTGFGHLARVRIDDDHLDALQRNLVRSHATGVGRPLDERVVRAIIALRANCLCRGHSGIRLETLDRLLDLLRAGIHPVIPEQGSAGASGDLAPLAHLALALIGEGEALHGGRRLSAATALRQAGLRPVRLELAEGLALINGTQVTAALGTLTLLRAERLATAADIAGAMSLEALMGSHVPFDGRIHRTRPHPGQLASAGNLRRILAQSQIVGSHADCDRVQDSYSLRCMPQVHGAVRDALAYVRGVLEIEINSSTDNPMVFASAGEHLSGGNFHGQPLALAVDHLGIATCSLGTISERRIDRLTNPQLSEGLPAFLARDPGLHSGFMLAQVTAAALVSENKVLAHPASVDTIPTSAAKEDHVSMSAHAARQAWQIVDHVATVLGIEVLCAAQALDLRRPLRPGRGVEAARRAVRRRIPALGADRVLAGDILRARQLVEDGTLVAAVEGAVGALR
jgi:histidine ammonia-lyase